jgi:hypothetical protein
MTRWFVIGAAVSFAWGSAAGAQQLKGLAAHDIADIAAVARTRALDLRISPQNPVPVPQRFVGGMLVSREVAPNAILGLGLANLYSRKKSGSDVRITGGPGRSRKPAVKFVLHF